jgi:hypothetical protein
MPTIALVAVCLISLAAMAIALLVVALVLYFFGFWKFALAVPFVAAGGAAIWCWRSGERRWPAFVIATGLVVVAVAMVFVFSSVWRSEAAHDAHLAGMVSELCGYQPPAGETLERCTGSITNTGNGNSCRYWARATIRESTSSDSVIASLQLDVWNEPMHDGLTYWRPSDTPSAIELSLMESWRPPDDDLRCT